MNFDFPPNHGIGGRRWAKIADQMAKMGHEIHVLKATPVPHLPESNWSKDVGHKNILIRNIDRALPLSFTHPQPGVKQKLAFHWNKFWLRKKHKGTIYDVALGTENEAIAKAKNLIKKHEIETLIATGAPFHWLYTAAKIKEALPHLYFLADYRDPYLTAKNYGMPSLTPTQMAHEEAKQAFIFEHADGISSPYQGLTELTLSQAKGRKPQAKVIPHAFDPQSLPPLRPQVEQGPFTLIYGGACYMGSEKYLRGFASAMQTLKEQRPDLHHRLQVKIFSDDKSKFDDLFEGNDRVRIMENIGAGLFEEINMASASIILLADHNKDFQTTKFWEFASRRKPIAYIGPEGKTANFLASEKLGVSVMTGELLASFMESTDWNRGYDFSKHTMEHTVNELIRWLP